MVERSHRVKRLKRPPGRAEDPASAKRMVNRNFKIYQQRGEAGTSLFGGDEGLSISLDIRNQSVTASPTGNGRSSSRQAQAHGQDQCPHTSASRVNRKAPLPQHPLHTKRSPTTHASWIKRFNQSAKSGPGHNRVHFRQNNRPLGRLRLISNQNYNCNANTSRRLKNYCLGK